TYALNDEVKGTSSVGKAVGIARNGTTSTTLFIHEQMKGNGGSQYVSKVIAQDQVDEGLIGFKDNRAWKQDEETKLPILIDEEKFTGRIPVYNEQSTIIKDENGIIIPIYSTEDLKTIAFNNAATARYRLMNDLDFEGVSWNPFELRAKLDGNGHTVQNL